MDEFQHHRRRLMFLMMAAAAFATAQPAAAHWPSPALVSLDVYDRTRVYRSLFIRKMGGATWSAHRGTSTPCAFATTPGSAFSP